MKKRFRLLVYCALSIKERECAIKKTGCALHSTIRTMNKWIFITLCVIKINESRNIAEILSCFKAIAWTYVYHYKLNSLGRLNYLNRMKLSFLWEIKVERGSEEKSRKILKRIVKCSLNYWMFSNGSIWTYSFYPFHSNKKNLQLIFAIFFSYRRKMTTHWN